MGKDTKIEWAHDTFNPWIGCERISKACDNCYAADWAARHRPGDKLWDGNRRRTAQANWFQPERWNLEAQRTGERRRVFCASLADVFDNAVPDSWRGDLFRLIRGTPNLDWLLLTKRIGNAAVMIRDALHVGGMVASGDAAEWPWPNVWLGATVVTQEEADRDIPKLLRVYAARRFVSIEPMLGQIDLRLGELATPAHLQQPGALDERTVAHGLHWVIAGGESGRNARPSPAMWYRHLRDQCRAAGVPFLFKQWGEWIPAQQVSSDTVTEYLRTHRGYAEGWTTGPSERVMRLGKQVAGRALDGLHHDGVPA